MSRVSLGWSASQVAMQDWSLEIATSFQFTGFSLTEDAFDVSFINDLLKLSELVLYILRLTHTDTIMIIEEYNYSYYCTLYHYYQMQFCESETMF